MHHPQQNQVQPPPVPGQPPVPVPPTPQVPGLYAANSFGSTSSPSSNVNLQLQQAAPLSSPSTYFPSPRQGGEKRCRNGRQALTIGTACATFAPPPMMPQHPDDDDDDDDTTPHSHESSSKKSRSAQYVAPRVVPTTFTSVTVPMPGPGGMRRNLSFSRIDPYVSYAQTPSLVSNNNNNGDGMDMDASNGNHSTAGGDQSRVRSMSF